MKKLAAFITSLVLATGLYSQDNLHSKKDHKDCRLCQPQITQQDRFPYIVKDLPPEPEKKKPFLTRARENTSKAVKMVGRDLRRIPEIFPKKVELELAEADARLDPELITLDYVINRMHNDPDFDWRDDPTLMT